jgi:hypothetical protein
MKFLIYIIIILLFACSSSKNDSSFTKIKFDKLNFNFNKISINDSVECSFRFANVGDTVLVIYKVKPSCGCTVPEWTTDHIKKGQNGIIKVKYCSKYPKEFSEGVLVYYNGKDSPIALIIHGEVIDY